MNRELFISEVMVSFLGNDYQWQRNSVFFLLTLYFHILIEINSDICFKRPLQVFQDFTQMTFVCTNFSGRQVKIRTKFLSVQWHDKKWLFISSNCPLLFLKWCSSFSKCCLQISTKTYSHPSKWRLCHYWQHSLRESLEVRLGLFNLCHSLTK